MLTLIIGGSGSGKSEFAESIATKAEGKHYYIATMKPFGEAGKRRIQRHKALRNGKGFETIEEYTEIQNIALERNSTALLEDLPNLVANIMFGENKVKDVTHYVVNTVLTLYNSTNNLIIVTGNIFADGEKYPLETMEYINIVGEINKALAQRADRVYEVVCGIAVEIMGGKI